MKYPNHVYYSHLNYVFTLTDDQTTATPDQFIWFENEKQYLVTTVAKENSNPTIWLVDVTGKKVQYPLVSIAPNQVLSIVQLVALDSNRIFLRGEVAATKKPTKKKCNWFAVCDDKGNIVQQKTSKYDPYQSADQWSTTQIGLLRNTTQKATFDNKATIDLLNLSDLSIEGKKVFQFNQENVFVNNFKVNRQEQSVLFIGLNALNKMTLDTSKYSTRVFSTFSMEEKFLFDHTKDNIELPLKYRTLTTPVPIFRANNTNNNIFYWEGLWGINEGKISMRHQITNYTKRILIEVEPSIASDPHLKVVGQTEQYLFSSHRSTSFYENAPLLTASSAKIWLSTNEDNRTYTFPCLWCPMSFVEHTKGISQKDYEFDRIVLARRQPYDEMHTHPRKYHPQRSKVFPDWYFIEVVMVYRAKNGTDPDKIVSLVNVYPYSESATY